MTSPDPFKDHPQVDPARTRPLNAFDALDGHSGQEYDRERDRAQFEQTDELAVRDGGGEAPPPAGGSNNPGIPDEVGQRASFDRKTGEVHGSGAGAGGGNPGEDYDTQAGGDDYPRTGVDGEARTAERTSERR